MLQGNIHGIETANIGNCRIRGDMTEVYKLLTITYDGNTVQQDINSDVTTIFFKSDKVYLDLKILYNYYLLGSVLH